MVRVLKNDFRCMKVTYNMYSCAISGMSREMIKMEGQDSAECQNWETKDIKVIIEIVLNEDNAKTCIVFVSHQFQKGKT